MFYHEWLLYQAIEHHDNHYQMLTYSHARTIDLWAVVEILPTSLVIFRTCTADETTGEYYFLNGVVLIMYEKVKRCVFTHLSCNKVVIPRSWINVLGLPLANGGVISRFPLMIWHQPFGEELCICIITHCAQETILSSGKASYHHRWLLYYDYISGYINDSALLVFIVSDAVYTLTFRNSWFYFVMQLAHLPSVNKVLIRNVFIPNTPQLTDARSLLGCFRWYSEDREPRNWQEQ